MKFKKSFLIICLIICLFSIASVCAGEANDTVMASEDVAPIELSQSDESQVIEQNIDEEIISDENSYELQDASSGNEPAKSGNDIDITIDTEYSGNATCYAGTNNTLTIKVTANKTDTYLIELFADGIRVDHREEDLIGGNEKIIFLTDATIRPIDETTVNGANNNHVTYTVNVTLGTTIIGTANKTAAILYNGYLGKDLSYPGRGMKPFLNVNITGDIVIDVKNASTFLESNNLNRSDVWNIALGESSKIIKSYVYVPYSWFNNKYYSENETMFNVTFNGESVAPAAWHRDQGNLGTYGGYGYGLLVYDVSDLVVDGENTFVLNKKFQTPQVHPSALIYMYNTTGSDLVKEICILNGADLLSNNYNKANRPVHSDSIIDVNSKNALNATLHVLASGAQIGEGNILFNGNEFEDIWTGTDKETCYIQLNVTGMVKDSNAISLIATGSSLTSIAQILVIAHEKEIEPSSLNVDDVTLDYGETRSVTVTFDGAVGITAKIGDKDASVNGNTIMIPLMDAGTYTLTVTTIPDEEHTAITKTATITVNKLKTELTASPITATYNVDQDLVITLKDGKNNALSGFSITVDLNGLKTYTTDGNGQIKVPINGLAPKTYNAKITFNGNGNYLSSSAEAKVIVKKASPKLTAKAKAFKKSKKVKKYTVTLKDNTKKPMAKAKLTLKIKGKTYKATTSKKGKATFKITKLTKKGKYKAVIKYSGNGFYNPVTAKAKITIK